MAKAWEVEGLAPDAELAACARRIVETRFLEMMSYREGTIRGEEIEQLHSMRVSTRRLRSALKNFGPCFDRAQLRYHAARIKEIADALGSVRDLDVRLAWLGAERAAAHAEEHPGIDMLVDRARGLRDKARVPMIELLEALESERYADVFLAFARKGGRTDG